MAETANSYICRTDMFHKPVTWKIDGDTLSRTEEGKPEQRSPLSQVSSVHLAATPSRYAHNMFFCTLELGGKKVKIGNTHFAGLADLKDQSAQFRPFMVALHQAIAQAAPAATGRIGSSWVGYVLALIFGWGGLAAIVALLIAFGTEMNGTTLVKCVVALFLVGAMWRYTTANKPRKYSPAALPLEVLPKG